MCCNLSTRRRSELGLTLIRTARFGALGTVDMTSGAPSVSRVAVATSMHGAPIILISRLSAHFNALENDARASLLLGEPGKGDPLAHPRISVAGLARKLEGAERELARGRFLARHPKASLYADFADFAFWQIDPDGASLNGGFAQAYRLGHEHIWTPQPEGLAEAEAGVVEHMNDDHSDAVEHYATVHLGRDPGPWRLACLDRAGLDLVLGDEVARLWFDRPLDGVDKVRPRLVALAKSARREGGSGEG